MKIMMGINASRTVCVTGASGFLGSHIVKILLENGFHVIAALRNPHGRAATELLPTMEKGASGRLEMYVGDLTVPGSYDDAFARSNYVIHCAAKVDGGIEEKASVARQMMDVNILGTKSVLTSLSAAKHVKKIVLTSSMAAVLNASKSISQAFDEDDWSDGKLEKTNAYWVSKIEAERRFCQKFEAPGKSDTKLVRIVPSIIIGPAYLPEHTKKSLRVILDLYLGHVDACPNFYFNLVDVRDIAQLHVQAILNDELEGRFLAPGKAISLHGISCLIKSAFPESRAPQRKIPDWRMYLSSILGSGPPITYLRRNLGKHYRFNDNKVKAKFDFQYRMLEESIVDTINSVKAL